LENDATRKTVILYTINNLKLELGGREVLDIPALDIPDHQIVALTGPNGSGKTSLLQVLGGLLPPGRGRIIYRDQDLFSQTSANLESIRKDLGIVLQSPYLFKTTVLNNVSYGLMRRGMSRAAAVEKSMGTLELSGGEAQRVALARALVLEPEVLLLDEPFANVDAVSRSVIERVLVQENSYRKTSVIFTTHDLEQAYRMSDTVVTLFGGRVHDSSMENFLNGSIRQTPDGPVFDTGSIKVAVPPGHEKAHAAAIPPESILVSLTTISTSARNTHHGRITAVKERNGTVDVTVDTGDVLIARITKRSYLEMGLVLGGDVYLIFKAEAVRLY
jgi:molybdopterin-binding protein